MAGQHKIVIIGAGHVGSHCALSLALAEVASEIVLVDSVPGKAAAQALDVADALSFPPHSVLVRGGDYRDASDAEIVIIAVGESRLPGQTRLDLLDRSLVLVGSVIDSLSPFALSGIVVTITNPADVVADFVRRGLRLSPQRCFGTGTLLDTARLVRLLSEKTGLARASIQAYVLGEHGDSSVVAFSQIRGGGLGWAELSAGDALTITNGVRQAGMDVVIGKGSTEFGIGQAVAALCRAIVNDEHRVFPVSAFLDGIYGQRGLHAGVPCRIGRAGIETIVELALSVEERAAFDASCRMIHTYQERAIAQEKNHS